MKIYYFIEAMFAILGGGGGLWEDGSRGENRKIFNLCFLVFYSYVVANFLLLPI
jgi:hypothetical protein